MTFNLKNSDRQLLKIIREICGEQDIKLETYSYDWILKLTKDNNNMYIYGYQFPLNDAAAELICGDKAALSAVLKGCGIPAAEHEFFMSPSNAHYIGRDGNWARLVGLLEKHGRLVCKRNSGSGGTGVYIVSNQTELERTVADIFRNSRSMAVSPFYDIANEFRVIMLGGDARLIYKKIRPHVTGDGKKAVYELAFEKFGASVAGLDITADLAAVPSAGEKVTLCWKHNLGQGSKAVPVYDNELCALLESIAVRAVRALDIKFASVDIIQTDGEYIILEINSGIMMENFAVSGDENYRTAKEIYRDAVNYYFIKKRDRTF
jgi:glutathione synthase/RimK-type ligase-like ATP-grasp enzyme